MYAFVEYQFIIIVSKACEYIPNIDWNKTKGNSTVLA